MGNLTPELEYERKRIAKIAKDCGLDCFDTVFELITYDQISQFAAYGGFPVRYPHWRFGMEYEQLSKSYEYGLSKIYEMVINTDPCYAYLMEGNSMMDQKLVMAHVFGHCDFFKNNAWFSKTNRKMIDQMANHATRIRRYIDRHGYETVEKFIDVCLSLENLIDRYSILRAPEKFETRITEQKKSDLLFRVDKPYMQNFINPKDVIDKKWEQTDKNKNVKFPAEPVKDILSFLMHFAPIEDWQQDILGIIKDEAYYFAPQGMTKTMNEGWFRCELIGSAEDGRKVRGVVKDKGDPGNRVTVQLLCESALSLAVNTDELPGGKERGGILTPATGLGEVLVERLQKAGMMLEVEQ